MEFAGAVGLRRVSDRRMMVVQCISNFLIGGTELNFARTVERLAHADLDIRVIALRDDGPLRQRLLHSGVPIETFGFAISDFPPASALRLYARLRRLAPDVVHCHDRYTNMFIAPVARAAGVPLVISSRRWWTAMPSRYYRAGNRLAYRLSHKVIANSPAVGRLLEDEGVPGQRIAVLPNFLDEHAFAAPAPNHVAEARAAFGIPAGSLVVAAVAILRPEKDLGSLIDAVGLVADRIPSLHLLLIGSGPCEAELRQRAGAGAFADRIHFAGFLRSPPNPHQYGDMSVLCSLHEGFPNSIIEAMAAGKAVVATDVGGIPDAVAHGETGFLVPPASPPDLAEAIATLASDPELRARMGEAARMRARASYDPEAVIGRLQAIYRKGKRC